MEPPEEAGGADSHQGAGGDAEQDRDREFEEGDEGQFAALGHADEGGEEDDHVDVVDRGAGHDHLRDPLRGAASLLDQFEHARDDDGGGDRREDRPEHGRFDQRKAEQQRSEDEDSDEFEGRRQKRQQERRPADFLQVAEVEREPGAQQDDHERDLAEVDRDRQDLRGDQIEDVRSEQDPGEDHPDDAGQFEAEGDFGQREAGQDDERKR